MLLFAGQLCVHPENALSMLEGMAWLTFHVAEDGVSIERKTTGVIPLVCQYTSGPVRFENVYLLEEYTEELAASHGIRNYAGVVLHLEDLQNGATRFSVISYSPKIRRSIISKPILLINNVSHTDDGTVVHSTDNDTFP